MSDDPQIEIPQSFIGLFVPPGRSKPQLPRAELLQRYELCEDMAGVFCVRAGELRDQLGITEDDVLQRIYRGLSGGQGALADAEAAWVVCRLAELNGWPLPLELLAPKR